MERRAMQDGTVAPARMPWRLLAVAASALALAACGSAASTTSTTSPPATTAATAASGTTAATTPIENCGVRVAPARPPARAVTLNQGATEVMLALGLQDRMIGTAYLDDRVAPAYAAAYRAVPVLAEEYPSREVRDLVLGTGMERGAGISYDRLEELVAELQRSRR